MGPGLTLALYAAGIALGALAGASIPVARPQTRRRTELFLSFSAGVMLGAAFFHMLPEAVHLGGLSSLGFVLVGFLFLFLLERYVLVHWCEEPEEAGCEVHGFHPHVHPAEASAIAAPAAAHGIHGTIGLAAFIGLSIHTVSDGFALGAALDAGVGTSVFLAIFAHKIPSSFSLAAILLHERWSRRRTLLLCFAFSLAVPLGAALYFGASGYLDRATFAPRALAFSAGSFLHLAVADLIPDLHRNRTARLPLSLALIAGIGVMLALSWALPDHGH